MVKVEQSDRDSAAAWLEFIGSQSVADFIRGKAPCHPLLSEFTDATEHTLVQAFAAHRLAAEQAARLEGVRMGLEAALAAAVPVVTTEVIPAREFYDDDGLPALAPGCTRTRTDYNAVARIKALDPATILAQGHALADSPPRM